MCKKMRLAVIGSTSSGKTYLLDDLIESFSRLGYRCVQNLDSLYATPFDFRLKIEDHYQTPVVACRKYNEYRGEFVNNNDRRKFNLGFLDIPGEIFDSERINQFIDILRELYLLDGYFVYDVYKRGRDTSKVLRFIGPDGKSEPSDGYQEIIKKLYTDRAYVKQNRLPGFLRKVTGRKLVTNFFDYDTESVLEAISQAVPYFSTESGIDQHKFIQNKVGMDMFYFFYVLYATDVVLCDKLVMPDYVKGGVTHNASPVQQMQRLYTIPQFRPCEKKYYMAFRGLDALINDCLDNLWKRGFSVDDVYAFIVFILEYRLNGRNKCESGDLEVYLGKKVYYYIMETGLQECVAMYLKDKYTVQPYYNQNFAEHCYGADLINSLNRRIQTAVDDFARLRNDLPEDMDIFMAPHVFLTSSAIASQMFRYQVTGNDPANVLKMEGPCAFHGQRACIGTIHLAMSLFRRNNISYENTTADDIAMIQNYIS